MSEVLELSRELLIPEKESKEPRLLNVVLRSNGIRGIYVFNIGKILQTELSRIFNKSESFIEMAIRCSVLYGETIVLGIYVNDVAKTKRQQAENIFSERVSFSQLIFLCQE